MPAVCGFAGAKAHFRSFTFWDSHIGLILSGLLLSVFGFRELVERLPGVFLPEFRRRFRLVNSLYFQHPGATICAIPVTMRMGRQGKENIFS